LAREFLRAADKVVTNLRASVFFGMVRKELERHGWNVTEIARPAGQRPDLLATERGGEREFRVVPRFALLADSTLLSKPLDRLTKAAKRDQEAPKGVVVVPDQSESIAIDPSATPSVVKLAEIDTVLTA
jgi:hypothetical protein